MKDSDRCQVSLTHRDESAARCVLAQGHQQNDSDHRDRHGCTAPVLVHQASIEEAARWASVPFPWER